MTHSPPSIEWRATNELRWAKYSIGRDGLVLQSDLRKGQFVLQQLWQASNGEKEWRSVEVAS